MSMFLRLVRESDKAEALMAACHHLRQGEGDPRCFEVEPDSFNPVPGKPFAYWVSESVRGMFGRLAKFEGVKRSARQGLATASDFRFVRLWWESPGTDWICYAKGGAYSRFYADIYLLVKWTGNGEELNCSLGSVIRNSSYYFRPGLTWPRRTTSGISLRPMPAGCIFGDKGPVVFESTDSTDDLLTILALTNSRAFGILVELQLAAADAAARSYEVGVIQRTPFPDISFEQGQTLAKLARRVWSLKRTADSVTETSHAFVLPAVLRTPTGCDEPLALKVEIDDIQAAIDAIAFDLYGFPEVDREVNGPVLDDDEVETEEDEEDVEAEVPSTDGLLSWAVGVAFGRFDLGIATGERLPPPEPEPFDPLPKKAPGMLPDGTDPFHAYEAILVDEQGHPHDLVHLVEEVLGRVKTPVPDEVRRWLRKEFFVFHLKLYSKSRRRAPIYWPLATASGSYTLWLYYPSLNSQTLYTAINDFIEPKLKQLGSDVMALRNMGATRSRDDENQFEALQFFELELIELRDSFLKLAPTYKPNHEDGVQIGAAPLWPLFRHKPWQKVLKDTWAKLEKGDYDWAHLAMNYWPDRVREKCKTDKSLAIAHGLEESDFDHETKSRKGRLGLEE